MKTLDISNGIAINASMFIIPNSACKIEDLFDFVRAENLELMEKICELNGMKFDPENDYLIQTWYLSEELGCDNIPDHCISVKIETGEKCTIGVEGHYLPSNLFKGKKEGDIINVKLPVWVKVGGYKNPGPAKDMVADFTIELAQLKYRYARFGRFEEVLEKVIAAHTI